jgi:hypothetical protein
MVESPSRYFLPIQTFCLFLFLTQSGSPPFGSMQFKVMRTAKPSHIQRTLIIRVMLLAIGITADLARLFDQLAASFVSLGVASGVGFLPR